MHNVLGWDGATPAGFRQTARTELSRYDHIEIIAQRIETVTGKQQSFALTAGTLRFSAERVLVATGVHDRLLPIPGVRELWGELVLPCPYCHGHELSAGPIIVISTGAHAAHVGALLRQLGADVPVLAPADVVEVSRFGSCVRVDCVDGRRLYAAGVFIPPHPMPRLSFAAALNLDTGPEGVIADALGRTSALGVWAAGDVVQRSDTRIPAAVVTSLAQGLTAAADISAAVSTHSSSTPAR